MSCDYYRPEARPGINYVRLPGRAKAIGPNYNWDQLVYVYCICEVPIVIEQVRASNSIKWLTSGYGMTWRENLTVVYS